MQVENPTTHVHEVHGEFTVKKESATGWGAGPHVEISFKNPKNVTAGINVTKSFELANENTVIIDKFGGYTHFKEALELAGYNIQERI